MKGIQRLFWGFTAALLNAASDDSAAAGPSEVPFDIQPQRLDDALLDWARQSGWQVILPTPPEDMVTPLVKGRRTPLRALEQLLAGTQVTYFLLSERYVGIHLPESESPPETAASARNASLVSMQPEEVLVTGSRLLGDIRSDGSVDTPAPVIVFDRRTLNELGISTLPELLKFIPQQPFGPIAGFAMENESAHVQMRGLGFDSTLLLINGRRTVASATSVAWNAFDLNTLPVAAVERVEVLSDSASAVYGADAIGGVVNIILKKEIPQPILDVHYGTADGGAEERRVSLSAGYSNDRFRASLVLDSFDRGFLLGAERDRWNNQDFRRFGSVDRRALTTHPGNVSSLTSANLPGLPSRFAAVPAGSTGVGLTSEDFRSTEGQRNRESLRRLASVVSEAQRRSAMAVADYDLTPATKVFGDFLYVDDGTVAQLAPTARTLIVPAANEFNPFAVPVAVDYLFTELGPRRSYVESQMYRAVLGLRGAWSAWEWELSLLRISGKGSSWIENSLNTAAVNAALSATDPAEALNVFSDGPSGSPALLASLIAQPSPARYLSEGTQGAAVLRGRLFTLPAGSAEMVIGGEWLHSNMLFDQSLFVAHDRSAAAGFAELRLPLVSAEMQVPAVEKLSLTIATRYDAYNDFGGTFNPQFGLVWRPVADLMLRASQGTSFRAPSLFELYAPRLVIPGIRVPDPLRNNELSSVTFAAGGNPELEPIKATSLTAGFEFRPSALPGLQLSGSYWRIQMQQRVSVLPYFILAANQARFPDRVVRAERTPEDISAGLPGRLTFLDVSRMNFGTLKTSGIDWGAFYTAETAIGRFTQNISATWIDTYDEVNIPGTQATNRVAVASPSGSVARWRAVASVGWTLDGVSLSATARYTAAYADVDVYGSQTGTRLPAATLIDLQGSVDFETLLGQSSKSLPALTLTAGVSNVFDREPHFAEVGYEDGFDWTQGDLRQRFGYLRLSARF
jgi:iron complex outermembrane receptor protein